MVFMQADGGSLRHIFIATETCVLLQKMIGLQSITPLQPPRRGRLTGWPLTPNGGSPEGGLRRASTALRRKHESPPDQSNLVTGAPSDGSLESIDQMASWVRFADTKATILAAGLGVVATMLASNVKTVVKAISEGCLATLLVGGLSVATVLAFLWTLGWLTWAIVPRSRVRYNHLNRFAWPSLVGATVQELLAHTARVDVQTDAWQQVLDLSQVASRKYSACAKAVYGFAALILVGLVCISTATSFAPR
ncbi:hypothetical protein [Mycobacterium sp. M23085]|uniref:hypothetical protein n=1 Tax=Mycobacterium sp. M23085 TaxID=3378087 RepID=UPI00387835FB